jgi:hypothetical protein
MKTLNLNKSNTFDNNNTNTYNIDNNNNNEIILNPSLQFAYKILPNNTV